MRGARPPRALRAEITNSADHDSVSFALSPNGERLHSSPPRSRGGRLLWIRSLSTGESAPLNGTEGAAYPFWSPDNRSIGFFANDRLISHQLADGGSLKELAPPSAREAPGAAPASVILYTMVPDAECLAGARGRMASPNSCRTDQKEPGGKPLPSSSFSVDATILYFVAEAGMRGVYVGALDRAERRHLFDADAAAVFVPPNEILFLRAGNGCMLQHFDAAALSIEGDPSPVARGVVFRRGVGSAWDESRPRRAPVTAERSSIAPARAGSGNWLGLIGPSALIGEPFPPDSASLLNPTISPDGRQIAMTRVTSGNVDIWLQDLTRKGAYTRLTAAPTPDIYPVWSPDGTKLAYGGIDKGSFAVKLISAAGGESTVAFDRPARRRAGGLGLATADSFCTG